MRSTRLVFSGVLEPIVALELVRVDVPAKVSTYERTKRSLFSQSGFFGLKFMNLLKRTWATGAIPIGAPGCPELALRVASTWMMN